MSWNKVVPGCHHHISLPFEWERWFLIIKCWCHLAVKVKHRKVCSIRVCWMNEDIWKNVYLLSSKCALFFFFPFYKIRQPKYLIIAFAARNTVRCSAAFPCDSVIFHPSSSHVNLGARSPPYHPTSFSLEEWPKTKLICKCWWVPEAPWTRLSRSAAD